MTADKLPAMLPGAPAETIARQAVLLEEFLAREAPFLIDEVNSRRPPRVQPVALEEDPQKAVVRVARLALHGLLQGRYGACEVAVAP